MVFSCFLAQDVVSEEVYFPGSQYWFDTRTGASYAGGHTRSVPVSEDAVPAFQRAGSIIPRKDRFRRSSTQMEFDPYTLVRFSPLLSLLVGLFVV